MRWSMPCLRWDFARDNDFDTRASAEALAIDGGGEAGRSPKGAGTLIFAAKLRERDFGLNGAGGRECGGDLARGAGGIGGFPGLFVGVRGAGGGFGNELKWEACPT
jgi:hypothetical protein